MTCVKQVHSPRLNCPTYYLLHFFSFLPILLLLSIILSPFYSLGDQMTLGLCSNLPLRLNANLFFFLSHSFICALRHPFSLLFFSPFQYWFLHFQRAGAPNWIHHNLLLMGLSSIAPLRPSLTYWCLKGLLVGWVIVHLRSTDGN